MVTGQLPFEGDKPLSIAMKHKGEIPKDPRELNPQIPEDLSLLILNCMEKDRGNRHPSVKDITTELPHIQKGIPPQPKKCLRKSLSHREK
jgi:serine/threonine-protein kinase